MQILMKAVCTFGLLHFSVLPALAQEATKDYLKLEAQGILKIYKDAKTGKVTRAALASEEIQKLSRTGLSLRLPDNLQKAADSLDGQAVVAAGRLEIVNVITNAHPTYPLFTLHVEVLRAAGKPK